MTSGIGVPSDGAQPVSDTFAAERQAGRLLIGLTYLSVGLLTVGVGLMIVQGISPLAGGPAFDLASLPAMAAGLEPAGIIWLGLLAVIAAPIGRVIVSGVSYARSGDRLMLAVSLAILAVIVVAVTTAVETAV